MTKNQPCCARREGKLLGLKGDLRRLAYRAALYEQQGRSTVKTLAQIAQTKDLIARAEQVLTDHEAEHADDTHRS